MTDHVIIDAGTLEFSDADLTASGLLVPFGVPARSNLGTFTFSAGDINLPEDLTGMSLNVEHKREDVVGGFSKVWEQPDTGIFASFKYANTPAGRQAYADGKSGKRRNLSAEVAKVFIRNQKALPGAVLFAAAQVEKPAFEGATLLAAEDTTAPYPAAETVPDPAHLAIDAEALPEDIAVTTPAGDSAVYTPEAAPAEDNPEGGSTVTATEAPAGAPATATVVPTTLLASAPVPVADIKKDAELTTVFAAMAAIKSGTDAQAADSATLLAALSDITTSGLAGAGVLQPAWVGKLWQGRRYQRKYIDLLNHQYGGIQLGGRKGFKLAQGTALVAKRGAEKTELPSGTASTSVFASTRDSYGYAADVAREWFDLEGGADVLQAFWEGVADSYAQVTDEDALKAIFLTASKTTTALDRLIAPDTYPTEYAGAIGQLIQGIDLIGDTDSPSFAIVNPIAWKQLIYTPKDLIPEFVNLAVNIGEGGAALVDGKVNVVKAPQSFFTGTVTTAPQTIVGAKNGIEFREQGETPIQIDAIDVAKNGLDRAIVGYLETFVVRPESLALIGTKP